MSYKSVVISAKPNVITIIRSVEIRPRSSIGKSAGLLSRVFGFESRRGRQ